MSDCSLARGEEGAGGSRSQEEVEAKLAVASAEWAVVRARVSWEGLVRQSWKDQERTWPEEGRVSGSIATKRSNSDKGSRVWGWKACVRVLAVVGACGGMSKRR